MPISQELLEILVCPKCKEKVTLSDDQTALICSQCRVAYPIEDDIPIMLVDQARPLG